MTLDRSNTSNVSCKLCGSPLTQQRYCWNEKCEYHDKPQQITPRKQGRTRYARAVQFFYTHAGFSYDPKTETKIQGRRRCARALAKAEAYAYEHNWLFEWEDDWAVGSHQEYYGEDSAYENSEPNTCETCVMWNEDRTKVLGSLGCIDDADANYRRVVQAELALEAMPRE